MLRLFFGGSGFVFVIFLGDCSFWNCCLGFVVHDCLFGIFRVGLLRLFFFRLGICRLRSFAYDL